MLLVFQISVLLLITLTGIILAAAEGQPLAAISGPLALASWYFVDYARLIQLPAGLISTLGFLGFLAAATEYRIRPQATLLAVGAHLLVYLTWIFLLQKKQSREYWWLFGLSILQIALASLATASVWFGVGLATYTLMATWTLSVFLLYRSLKHVGEIGPAGESQGVPVAPIVSGIGSAWNGISRGSSERLATPRLFMNTFSVTCLSLVISVLFFLFIPRVWLAPRLSEGLMASPPLVGFSNDVRLGDMGEILGNQERALTVKAFTAGDHRPLTASELGALFGSEPLFRGGVLENYSQGRWYHQALSQRPRPRNASNYFKDGEFVLEMTIEPIGTETAFTYGDTVGAKSKGLEAILRWENFSNELRRAPGTDQGGTFHYQLAVTRHPFDTWLSIRRRRLLAEAFVAELRGENPPGPMTPDFFGQYLRFLTEVPQELAALDDITRNVIDAAPDELAAAQAIESWFTDSGEFSYSLKLTVEDAQIDPVLDFVQNRRVGHCEYFASAMALMLRTLHIPSRVVTGFKGGIFLPESSTLIVQQLHAHAWVEAYIDGIWRVYDPTPAQRDKTVATIQRNPTTWRQVQDAIEATWIRGTMLSKEGQERQLYEPIAKAAVQGFQSTRQLLQGEREALAPLAQFLRSPQHWFSWQGVMLTGVVLLLLAGLAWILRRLFRGGVKLLRWLRRDRPDSASWKHSVPFYERFAAILSRHGVLQHPTQTAKEFVHQVLPILQPQLAARGLSAWPEHIVEKFYQVRFGGEPLSPGDLRELNRRLDELERMLQQSDEPESPLHERKNFLAFSGLFLCGLLLFTLLLAAISGVHPLQKIHFSLADLLMGMGAALGMMGVFGFISPVRQQAEDIMGPPLAACRWYDLLLLAMLVGLIEELLFRGVLEPWGARLSPTAALIGVNLIFGLLHAVSIPYAIVATLLGGVLSLLARWPGEYNLLRPIMAHALYDFIGFLWIASSWRRRRSWISLPSPKGSDDAG
jgi:transglutaminase-like putative cysteine protease